MQVPDMLDPVEEGVGHILEGRIQKDHLPVFASLVFLKEVVSEMIFLCSDVSAVLGEHVGIEKLGAHVDLRKQPQSLSDCFIEAVARGHIVELRRCLSMALHPFCSKQGQVFPDLLLLLPDPPDDLVDVLDLVSLRRLQQVQDVGSQPQPVVVDAGQDVVDHPVDLVVLNLPFNLKIILGFVSDFGGRRGVFEGLADPDDFLHHEGWVYEAGVVEGGGGGGGVLVALHNRKTEQNLQYQRILLSNRLYVVSHMFKADPCLFQLMQQTDNRPLLDQALLTLLKDYTKAVPIGEAPLSELGLRWKNQNDFEQLKHILSQVLEYPCSDLADIHRDSNRLGILDLPENNSAITHINFDHENTLIHCSCCGFLLQPSPIPLSTPIKRIGNIGLSTFLYFESILSLSSLLAVNLLVYGLFALVTNVMAASKSVRKEVNEEWLLRISMSAKQLNATEQNGTYLSIQCWLGMVTVAIWCIMLVIIKYTEKRDEIQIETSNKSASDFSIVMHGVPTSMDMKEMQAQLDEYYVRLDEKDKPKELDRRFKIVKYNMAVPFYLNMESIKTHTIQVAMENLQALKNRIIGWVLERKELDSFSETMEAMEEALQQYSRLKKKIENQHRRTVRQIISNMKKKERQEPKTAVYITFDSSRVKDLLLRLNVSNSLVNTKKKWYFCKRQEVFSLRYQNQQVEVLIRQAPEPEDIIWNNLGQNLSQMACKKFFTYFITSIILGGSFGIIYILSVEQNKSSKNLYLSFLISIAISVINVLLQQAMKFLTRIQREFTQTKHQRSLAIKSILAQLINSILLPFIVNHYIEDNLYLSSGLAYDVVILSLTNAFLVPLLKVFDIYYLMTRLMAWYYRKPHNKLYLTQEELNEINSYMEFEVGYQYIYLVNLFIFICFFVSLQPIILFVGLLGYLAMHWSQKYSLLNRMRRPYPGNDLINTAMYQIIYFGPLAFSMGNFTWCNLIPHEYPSETLIPNIVSLGLSVVIIVLPYKSVFEFFFRNVYSKEMFYEEERIYLPSEYDRLNPATSKEAVGEYVEYVQKFRESLKNKTKEELLKIEEIFSNQKQKGHRKIPSIINFMSNFDTLTNVLNAHQQTQNGPQNQHRMGLKQMKEREGDGDGDGDEDEWGSEPSMRVVNPLSLFKNLHVVNKPAINFVQNWALNAEEGQDNEGTPKNLNYEILQNLLDQKYHQEQINSANAHELSLNKISPEPPKPIFFFGAGLFSPANKEDSSHREGGE